jgi:hypothetical protein
MAPDPRRKRDADPFDLLPVSDPTDQETDQELEHGTGPTSLRQMPAPVAIEDDDSLDFLKTPAPDLQTPDPLPQVPTRLADMNKMVKLREESSRRDTAPPPRQPPPRKPSRREREDSTEQNRIADVAGMIDEELSPWNDGQDYADAEPLDSSDLEPVSGSSDVDFEIDAVGGGAEPTRLQDPVAIAKLRAELRKK